MIFVFYGCLFYTLGILAVVPTDPDDLGSIFMNIDVAAKAGNWLWLAALVLMLVTWFISRIFKHRIPKRILPWLAIGLATTTQFLLTLANGGSFLAAVGRGLSLGFATAGGYSAIGRYIPGIRKGCNDNEVDP